MFFFLCLLVAPDVLQEDHVVMLKNRDNLINGSAL